MAETLNRLVSTQRVETLLECYGADPAAWPADERQAARVLLERNPELHGLRDQAMQLDAAMQAYTRQRTPEPEHISALTEQIMQALPRRHRLPGWLMGMAASLVIVGILVFARQSVTTQDQALSSLAQIDDRAEIFYDWAWEDVTGEVVAGETNDSDFFPLYALVATELSMEQDP